MEGPPARVQVNCRGSSPKLARLRVEKLCLLLVSTMSTLTRTGRPGSSFSTVLLGLYVYVLAGPSVNVVILFEPAHVNTPFNRSKHVLAPSASASGAVGMGGGGAGGPVGFAASAWLLAVKVLCSFELEHAEEAARFTAAHQLQQEERMEQETMEMQRQHDLLRQQQGGAAASSRTLKEFLSFEKRWLVPALSAFTGALRPGLRLQPLLSELTAEVTAAAGAGGCIEEGVCSHAFMLRLPLRGASQEEWEEEEEVCVVSDTRHCAKCVQVMDSQAEGKHREEDDPCEVDSLFAEAAKLAGLGIKCQFRLQHRTAALRAKAGALCAALSAAAAAADGFDDDGGDGDEPGPTAQNEQFRARCQQEEAAAAGLAVCELPLGPRQRGVCGARMFVGVAVKGFQLQSKSVFHDMEISQVVPLKRLQRVLGTHASLLASCVMDLKGFVSCAQSLDKAKHPMQQSTSDPVAQPSHALQHQLANQPQRSYGSDPEASINTFSSIRSQQHLSLTPALDKLSSRLVRLERQAKTPFDASPHDHKPLVRSPPMARRSPGGEAGGRRVVVQPRDSSTSSPTPILDASPSSSSFSAVQAVASLTSRRPAPPPIPPEFREGPTRRFKDRKGNRLLDGASQTKLHVNSMIDPSAKDSQDGKDSKVGTTMHQQRKVHTPGHPPPAGLPDNDLWGLPVSPTDKLLASDPASPASASLASAWAESAVKTKGWNTITVTPMGGKNKQRAQVAKVDGEGCLHSNKDKKANAPGSPELFFMPVSP